MFLRKLELVDVRCFKHLSLDFSKGSDVTRKWTILLGENGTGKSTILRAAALVLAGTDALAEILGQPGSWIRNGADKCTINATIVTAEDEARELSLVIERHDGISDVLTKNHDSLGPLMRALSHSNRSYFVAGYGTSRRLSSERSIGSPSASYQHDRSNSVATLFDNDAVLNPLESWAMALDYQQGETGVGIVEEVLNSFLPGVKFSHIDKKQRKLIFETPDGDVSLEYLSDGYQNVAAWAGDLLHRITSVFEDYSAPLETRGLLIVDEVDLHLHPKWQKSLLGYLEEKLPNMQLLVTTHSAITAQQADAEEVHYLVRDGTEIAISRIDIDPSKFQISQLLMTDAFGLQSEQALRVEKKKDEYRRLRDIRNRSQQQESTFRSLKRELQDYSKNQVEDEAADVSTEQNQLLRRIERELKAKRDD